jgi:hypothetical protein
VQRILAPRRLVVEPVGEAGWKYASPLSGVRTGRPVQQTTMALHWRVGRTKRGPMSDIPTKLCFCLVNERIHLRKLFFEAYKLFLRDDGPKGSETP